MRVAGVEAEANMLAGASLIEQAFDLGTRALRA
jgi:hypothetical protein